MTNYVVPPRTDDVGEIVRWRQSVADAINSIKTSLWGTDGAGDGGLYSASTVTTQAVSDIATTTATGNGNVTALGTPNATQHGVCWNTSASPTINNSKTEEGAPSATGAFTSSMTGLSAETLYYVRAYVTNALGTAYGDSVEVTTIDENLVLYYKLDETTGTTAVDAQGNSNGTLTNTAGDDSEWVTGKSGNALDIAKPVSSPWPYLNSNATWQTTFVDSFSISMWFKADDGQTGASNQYLFGSQKSGAGDTLIAYIDQYGALTTFYKSNILAVAAGYRLANGAMADYAHVVFVYEQTAATTATFRIYYNSTLIATADKTSITFSTWSSDVNLFFGSYNYRNQANYLGECFDGPIDQIRIYNIALTQTQVTARYNAGN